MTGKVQARQGMVRETGGWRWIVAAGLGVAVLAALFFANWKSRFAEPPAYLFGTRTPEAEAAYCLAVAGASGTLTRGRVAGGMTMMLNEQAGFWLLRLRAAGGDLAGTIAGGEAALGRDLARGALTDSQHLATAARQCGDRAVWLGYRFRALD